MKTFRLLLIFPIFLFCAGCSICDCKKVPCPAFTDTNFDIWLPYKDGDELIFKPLSNETEKSRLRISRSVATEVSKGCYGAGRGCFSHIQIGASDSVGLYTAHFTIQENIDNPFTGMEQKYVLINIMGGVFTGKEISDNGLVPDSSQGLFLQSQFYSNYILNNKQFDNVQELTADTVTTKMPRAYKIFLSKNKGIVGYETFPQRKLWVKQN